MHRLARFCFGFAILAALGGAVQPPEDVWRNPSNSVHVRFSQCGEELCGTVVWASEKAIADTRKGGGGELVGTQIFRRMREVRPGQWKGRVFVPDINHNFQGTIIRIDADHLLGKGCLVLGALCKSQTWTRIPQ